MSRPGVSPASNPYTYSKPVSGLNQFFGREQELNYVFDCIAKRACVNVVGERRIGKTSFLRHLLHPEVQAQYNPGDDGAVYLYLDPEIMTPKNPHGFYAEVLRQPAVREQLLAKCGDRASIPKVIANLIGEQALASGVAADMAGERGMRAALDLIKPCSLVLLVDEFEIIARCGGFALEFFEFLRGIGQTDGICLVLATSIPLFQCCPQDVRSSPFPNIFQRLVLGPFAPDEVSRYVEWTSAPIAAPLVDVQEEIYRLSGGSPYLVQMACTLYYWAWSQGETLGPALFPRIQYEFRREARAHFERVWSRHLTDEERDLLRAIARQGPACKPYSEVVWALHERGHLVDGRIASRMFAQFVAGEDGDQEEDRDFVGEGVSQASGEESALKDGELGLWVDLATELVYIDGQLLEDELTDLEYKLLKLLWENVDAVCSFYRIVTGVWGEEYIADVDDQRIHALVRRLRRKVEPNGRPWKYIVNVFGRGLRLENRALSAPSVG